MVRLLCAGASGANRQSGKGNLVAKLSNDVQRLLGDLASDPTVLGQFIQHPDRVIQQYGIKKEEADSVKNLLAVEVAKRLVVYDDDMHIHWV